MNSGRLCVMLSLIVSVMRCQSFTPDWQSGRRQLFVVGAVGAVGAMDATDQANEWIVPETSLSGKVWDERPKAHLTTSLNATLPIAMMVLDPNVFPSRSMAMRAIRKKDVFVKRDLVNLVGKADSRIYPSDIIVRRNGHHSDGYQGLSYAKPIVPLPVVYEDDHMSIVNKPAEMICHSLSKGGYNNNSVLRVAPHVLQPPREGTKDALEYPALVHRLDASTSGLLVLAKTRDASVHLAEQFEGRNVVKTYTALLQGEPSHGEIIDHPIDGKLSVTIWKKLQTVQTTKGILCLVEFYPQSGRKHQLRKHAAQVLNCPIVGDELYGSSIGRSLFLCANAIRIQHPFDGRWIEQRIELPKRFDEYITREEKRFVKHQEYLER